MQYMLSVVGKSVPAGSRSRKIERWPEAEVYTRYCSVPVEQDP